MIQAIEIEEPAAWEADIIPVETGTQQPRPRATRNPMLLHCGGKIVERDDLFAVPTPRRTRSWFPLPHRSLVHEVEDQLLGAGFQILAETHALSHEGLRYFGIMELSPMGDTTGNGEHGWVVGLRNSHDKRFPAGLVAGTRTFICDNLSFTGEVKISRKHTRFAERDLRHLTARAVGRLGERFGLLDRRIEAYKGTRLSDPRAHDIVVKAVDARVIGATQLPAVLEHWRKPPHEEFAPRNAWSLQNAFTEVFKAINPHAAIPRCEALNGLLDGVCGVALEA